MRSDSPSLKEISEYLQFGEKVPLPSNSSKTIHFVREEKFAVPSSPTQLTEGIPPDATPITMNQLTTRFQAGY